MINILRNNIISRNIILGTFLVFALSLFCAVGLVGAEEPPVYNMQVTGHLEDHVVLDGDGNITSATVSGSIIDGHDFRMSINGNLLTYVKGQSATFEGNMTNADLTWTYTGGVNYNGFDTLSAAITGTGADGYVYLIGYFAGDTGDFIGQIITQDTPKLL